MEVVDTDAVGPRPNLQVQSVQRQLPVVEAVILDEAEKDYGYTTATSSQE
jgi:hypothetical protein